PSPGPTTPAIHRASRAIRRLTERASAALPWPRSSPANSFSQGGPPSKYTCTYRQYFCFLAALQTSLYALARRFFKQKNQKGSQGPCPLCAAPSLYYHCLARFAPQTPRTTSPEGKMGASCATLAPKS